MNSIRICIANLIINNTSVNNTPVDNDIPQIIPQTLE